MLENTKTISIALLNLCALCYTYFIGLMMDRWILDAVSLFRIQKFLYNIRNRYWLWFLLRIVSVAVIFVWKKFTRLL